MGEQPENLVPEDAVKRVHEVTRKTRRHRRIYVGGFVALGVVTIGFFAIIGIVPSGFIDRYTLPLVLVPVLVYWALIRFRDVGGNRKRDVKMEGRLMSYYAVGLLLAILINFFLVGTKSWVVVVPAIIPAGVCFFGGWWFARHP